MLDDLGATAVFLGSALIMVIVCVDVGVLGPAAPASCWRTPRELSPTAAGASRASRLTRSTA
jgi:hypothetical protein